MAIRDLRTTWLIVAILPAVCCARPTDRRCTGCVIVEHDRCTPPLVPEGKTGLVVLVHGIGGFGDGWVPVFDVLARRRDLAHFAFRWPGPFGNTTSNVGEELRACVQTAIRTLPSAATTILLIGHSAGGPVAEYAARRLEVRPGVTINVALIDPARTALAEYQPVDPIATPLDGDGRRAPPATQREPPAGVTLREYRATSGLGRVLGVFDRARPSQNDMSDSAKERIKLRRDVGHGDALGTVVVPLIESLGRGEDEGPDAPERDPENIQAAVPR